jgi:hypothetical protein
MTKWLLNFEKVTVGNDRILSRLENETGRLNNGEDVTYGFGIGVTEYMGLKVILHSGHDAGYRAFDAYFIDHKLGIVILSNFYSLNPSELGYKIAEIFLANFLNEPEYPTKPETDALGETESDTTANIELSLYDYIGRYFSEELETSYVIDVDQEILIARHWRNDDVALTPTDIDRFVGDREWFESVVFTRDAEGKVEGLQLTTGRIRNLRFKRIE